MKKSELLNGLQEEYQQWEAFLDQIDPARMDQPGVSGHPGGSGGEYEVNQKGGREKAASGGHIARERAPRLPQVDHDGLGNEEIRKVHYDGDGIEEARLDVLLEPYVGNGKKASQRFRPDHIEVEGGLLHKGPHGRPEAGKKAESGQHDDPKEPLSPPSPGSGDHHSARHDAHGREEPGVQHHQASNEEEREGKASQADAP